MTAKEADVKQLLAQGQKFVDTAAPLADIADLKSKLEKLRGDWRDVKDKSGDRHEKMKTAGKLDENFHDHLNLMLGWLQYNEEKLEHLSSIELNRDVVAKQLKDAQVSEENE